MPAIWKDATGDLLELPGPGGGIVVCGALPGAAAPVPAWLPGELAAAGVPAEPGRVRDGTGLGLASAVLTTAVLDAALAGTPARRARKITPRLMMELSLARALEPGTAPAVLRALAQRPREADPGYDLPAASSLSDADAFLQAKPFLRLLALLSGEVRPVPLPGVRPVFPPPGTADGDQTALRLRPLERPGGPWRDGRWHGLRVLAKDGTVRAVADPKGTDRKGEHGQSRNAAHFGRPASTGAPAAPQARMVEVTDVWARGCVAWAAGPHGTGETTLAGHLEPACGPGDLDLADRGFPSSQAVVAKVTAGKHFAWRVSSAWKLRRSGRPLSDGTWKTAITWRGRTVKVRVVEYHMDRVFGLPPGHPLLAATPPAGVSVLGDGGAACRQPDDGTIRVEVSETVTIITDLLDPVAYPARDIAELYGMRWASELVYLEEKQTLSAGQPLTAATRPGRTGWPPPPSPPTRHCGSPAPRSPRWPAQSPPGSAPPRCGTPSPRASAPGKDPASPPWPAPSPSSAATSRGTRCGSSPPGGPDGTTPATPSRKSEPAKAGTPSPPRPGCTCSRCPSRRLRSRTRRQPPDPGPASPARHRRAGTPACPGSANQPQQRGSPRTGASVARPVRTRITKRNRNSSRAARTRPAR
jgi:hypothetical protein